MCITQVGQVALSAWRIVLVPRSILTDAEAGWCFSCGHVGSWASLNSDQTLLQGADVPLLEAKKAAGELRSGSLIPKPPFLREACARSQAPMGAWTKEVFERGLHPLSTKGGD